MDMMKATAGQGMATPIFWLQVRALTVANLKSRYRNTVAGFIWVVINPLVMFGAQSYAFHHVLRLNIDNYPLFLLSGLLPWIFIAQSLEMCTSILVTSGRLLKSYPVHPLVYLISQLADNLVNFLAAFTLLLLPIWLFYGDVRGSVGFLFLPLPLATLATGVLGLAWFLATAQVFYRDTRFVVSFVLSIAFFLTPVFYPPEFVPEKFRFLLYANPIHYLIVPFRVCIYDFKAGAFFRSMLPALVTALGLLTIAAAYWRKKRSSVYVNL